MSAAARSLSAGDLLAGSALEHEITVPPQVLGLSAAAEPGTVRVRPLTVGALAVISKAARDDPGLTPPLIVKEALVDPVVSVDQVRRMPVGLVHFLVGEINRVSGLGPDGEAEHAAVTPVGEAHLLFAQHFGWTPQQVAELSPGQIMVYLSGIDRLLADKDAGSDAVRR